MMAWFGWCGELLGRTMHLFLFCIFYSVLFIGDGNDFLVVVVGDGGFVTHNS